MITDWGDQILNGQALNDQILNNGNIFPPLGPMPVLNRLDNQRAKSQLLSQRFASGYTLAVLKDAVPHSTLQVLLRQSQTGRIFRFCCGSREAFSPIEKLLATPSYFAL